MSGSASQAKLVDTSAGRWCPSPSGRRSQDLHRYRKSAANKRHKMNLGEVEQQSAISPPEVLTVLRNSARHESSENRRDLCSSAPMNEYSSRKCLNMHRHARMITLEAFWDAFTLMYGPLWLILLKVFCESSFVGRDGKEHLDSTEDEQIGAVRILPNTLLLVDPLPAQLVVRRVVEEIRHAFDELVPLVLRQDRDVGLGQRPIDDTLQRGRDDAVVVSGLFRFEEGSKRRRVVHCAPVHVPVLGRVVFVLFVQVSDLRDPGGSFAVLEVPNEGEDAVGTKSLRGLLQSSVPVLTPVPRLSDDDGVVARTGVERLKGAVVDGDAGRGRE